MHPIAFEVLFNVVSNLDLMGLCSMKLGKRDLNTNDGDSRMKK